MTALEVDANYVFQDADSSYRRERATPSEIRNWLIYVLGQSRAGNWYAQCLQWKLQGVWGRMFLFPLR